MSYNVGSETSNKIIIQNKKSYDSFVESYESYINFIGFFDDKKNYGFRNQNNLQIIPKINKNFSDNEYNIFALDFVIIAYKQFVEKYFFYLSNGKISKNSVINPGLSAPYKSEEGLNFEPILEKNKIQFLNRIDIDKHLSYSCLNEKGFIKAYSDFVAKLQSKTQTHLKYLKTYKLKNINGLTITILDKKFSNDQEKVNFINDVNFDVYRKLAEQYGFYVNRDAPWQLIANLSHPNIKEIIRQLKVADENIGNIPPAPKTENFMTDDNIRFVMNKKLKITKQKIPTTEEIIKEYYDQLLFIDYESQKKFFYDLYVELVELRPFITETYYCAKSNSVKTKQIFRDEATEYITYLKNNKLLFLYTYLKILNIENFYKYNNVELENIFSKTAKKLLDEKEAVLYIYSQFETVTP